jgi:hypothetical protein
MPCLAAKLTKHLCKTDNLLYLQVVLSIYYNAAKPMQNRREMPHI